MEAVAVIDFETTGLSPDQGDRATEIGAVIIENGRIVDRYQSLMNAGRRIPAFIEDLTGITNDMIRRAPSAADVMNQVADFVGDLPLVAHNASFDSKFWDAELSRVRRTRQQPFACSMRVARRVFPSASCHKLGDLIRYTKLPVTGSYHRALADAEMAANLTLHMERQLIIRFGLKTLSHGLMQAIQQAKTTELERCIERFRRNHSI